MRDIKFKGYNKENKKWLKSMTIIKDKDKYFIMLDELQDGELKPTLPVEEASIGQYTGFKDKNGVEIYEGDIVEYVSDTLKNEDNKVFIVEWETETNNGWLIRNYNYPDETAVDNEHLSYWLNDYIGLQSEVVGNIYEEKLKESK